MKRILTVLPITLTPTAADSNRLLGLLEMFNAVVPCAKIAFRLLSLPGIAPKVFLYRIEAADGRLWEQEITFDNMTDPQMTFSVSVLWRLSEFTNQRNVRNALVEMVGAYPSLERVVYDYLVV